MLTRVRPPSSVWSPDGKGGPSTWTSIRLLRFPRHCGLRKVQSRNVLRKLLEDDNRRANADTSRQIDNMAVAHPKAPRRGGAANGALVVRAVNPIERVAEIEGL